MNNNYWGSKQGESIEEERKEGLGGGNIIPLVQKLHKSSKEKNKRLKLKSKSADILKDPCIHP